MSPVILSFCMLSLLVAVSTTSAAEAAGDHCPLASHKMGKIGGVIDSGSRVGKEMKVAMEMAAEDFARSSCSKQLALQLEDSSGDLAGDASFNEEQNTQTIITKEKGSGSGAHDANNPFFVHHSDHPGMVLVPKLLNGDNYTTWCRSIRLSLGAKNKLGFIEGTINIPSAENNPDQYSHWLQCNDMVLSWILNSVQPEIADSVIYSTTAHEIWEDLKERFSQSNTPRIFQLQREITSLTQGQLSVAGYFTKMKGLWDELASYNDLPICSCGAMKKHHEREERNGLLQFLMGLNESYSAVRGQILLMNPLPNLRKAYALVSQEEKQRELGSTRVMTESAAMVVRSNQNLQRSNKWSNNGQQQQSRFNHAQPSPKFNQQSVLCSHCGDTNHVVETCWKLNGYPSWHKLHKTGGGNSRFNGGGGRRKLPSSANHVDANQAIAPVDSNPSFGEVKTVMPNLTNQQYKQICSVLKEKESSSQIGPHEPFPSSGFGYEEDDWCG